MRHRPTHRIRSAAGFSLVELLVVLVVLAVVLSMLLPALSHARLAARRTACAVNLRSLRDALTMYMSADSRGMLPFVESPTVVRGMMTESRIRAPFETIAGHLGMPLPTPRDLPGALPMIGAAPQKLAPMVSMATSPFLCPDDRLIGPRLSLSYDLSVSVLYFDPSRLRIDRRNWLNASRQCDDQFARVVLWSDLNVAAHDRLAPPNILGAQSSFNDGLVDWSGYRRVHSLGPK